MRTVLWIIVALLIAAGIWFWWNGKENMPSKEMQESAQGPTGSAGINGSPNQGNLGQPDSGQPQQPGTPAPILAWTPESGADGEITPIVGSNLTLGTDGTDALGTYLIGYTGMPLYTYDKDTGATATCTGTCATSWPPYVVAPTDIINQVKLGVDGSLVGTTTVPAGYRDPSGYTIQLTYKGHPLYFYAADTSGKAAGDGKAGLWHVVKP